MSHMTQVFYSIHWDSQFLTLVGLIWPLKLSSHILRCCLMSDVASEAYLGKEWLVLAKAQEDDGLFGSFLCAHLSVTAKRRMPSATIKGTHGRKSCPKLRQRLHSETHGPRSMASQMEMSEFFALVQLRSMLASASLPPHIVI